MEAVKLLRVRDRKVVNGELLPLSVKHLADFDTFWKPRLQNSAEQDSHWDWVKKYVANAMPNYEKYALECEYITQGLMLLELDCHRSRLESGKPLLYIDYLATAPWNRPTVQDLPTYRGVGTALITFTIKRSVELEYKGRVGLHALPLAENFYKQLQMIDFGLDAEKQNLKYFELSTDKAMEILGKP